MNFQDSQTRKNLAKAYISECQDSARYALISLRAREDEKIYIANALSKLSKIELAHATIFYNILIDNGIKKMENIEITASYPFETIDLENGIFNSAQSEKYQIQNIYPDYEIIARDENFEEISKVFENILVAETKNFELLNYISLNFSNLYANLTQMECINCGFTKKTKKPWKTCPLCHKNSGFIDLKF